MTFVVTDNCIKCKYMDCVEVCPVDCFYEGENMLVIHPDECIDCGVCEPECPARSYPSRYGARPRKLAEAERRICVRYGRTLRSSANRRPMQTRSTASRTNSPSIFRRSPALATDPEMTENQQHALSAVSGHRHRRHLHGCGPLVRSVRRRCQGKITHHPTRSRRRDCRCCRCGYA